MVVGTGLTLLTLGLLAVTLSVGDVPVPLSQVLATLVGRGDETSTLVLVEFRLPRLVLGVLVGIALGLSGALFQSVLRNPLASPDIIGITEGASVGAVYALLVLGLDGVAVSVAALIGAAVVGGLNYALAWRNGVTGYRFVLCGVGLAFVAASILGYLLTRSDAREAQEALVWLSGSIASATWEGNARLAVALVVLVPAALVLAPGLGMLGLGDDTASALGVPAQRVRLLDPRRRYGARRDRHRRRRAGGVRGAGLGAHRPTARRPRQPGPDPLGARGRRRRDGDPTSSPCTSSPTSRCRWASSPAWSAGRYLIWLLATQRGGSGNR